jgi:hypothetical protein
MPGLPAVAKRLYEHNISSPKVCGDQFRAGREVYHRVSDWVLDCHV